MLLWGNVCPACAWRTTFVLGRYPALRSLSLQQHLTLTLIQPPTRHGTKAVHWKRAEARGRLIHRTSVVPRPHVCRAAALCSPNAGEGDAQRRRAPHVPRSSGTQSHAGTQGTTVLRRFPSITITRCMTAGARGGARKSRLSRWGPGMGDAEV
jgi:hypothetical protein